MDTVEGFVVFQAAQQRRDSETVKMSILLYVKIPLDDFSLFSLYILCSKSLHQYAVDISKRAHSSME